MLPKGHRIRKQKDFEIIFKNSRSFKGSFFILKIAKNNLGLNRFGFVVSQKVSKKAVVRNKIKRRLSEILKLQLENIKSGTDLILITLPSIEKRGYSEIKESILDALDKSKCLNL